MGRHTGPSCRASDLRLRVFLGGSLALTFAYFLVPGWHMVLWALLGVTSAGAVLAGVRVHRPDRALPWYLLAAGLLTFAAGDFSFNLLVGLLHEENPFPSFADGFYLAMYPLCAAALALFIRARTPDADRAGLIDALIITVGLGLLSWVYLIQPTVSGGGLTLVDTAISVSYPLGDVLLLAMLARLLRARGHGASLLLLAAATGGMLVADASYGLIQLNGDSWKVGGPVDLGWVCFYVLVGAAALHPSMTALTRQVPAREVDISRGWLYVIGSASLIAPGDWLLHWVRGAPPDSGAHAVVSIALFVLVISRMSGILRSQQASNVRERTLRRASAQLVAAQDAEQIAAALEAALQEFAGGMAVRSTLLVREGAFLIGPAFRGRLVDMPLMTAALAGPHPAFVAADVLSEVRFPPLPSAVGMVVPLRLSSELLGALVLVGNRQPMFGLRSTIETLGLTAALALERIALALAVHQRASEAHFRSLIQNSSDMIVVLSAARTIRYQTPSVARALGLEDAELVGASLELMIHPEDRSRATAVIDRLLDEPDAKDAHLDVRLPQGGGGWIETEVICSNLLRDPSVEGLVLTFRDVTQRRMLEREMTRRAFHDGLTGLANRALFADHLENALRRGARSGALSALLFLDLDDFKTINDSRGHALGDAVLRHVGGILTNLVRSGDTVGRLGGDEFAILIEDAGDEARTTELAERLLAEIREPVDLEGRTVYAQASIGIATSEHSTDAPELLRFADLALYEAKRATKGTYRYFRDGLRAEVVDRSERRARLQQALDGDQFRLLYQPIVELDSGQLVGMEALVRWHDPLRGVVPPDEFIPDAEESGMIVPLGTWVLREALRQCGAWQAAHPDGPVMRLSVNVSPRQVREPGFLQLVTTILEETPPAPWTLVFELTESLLIEDPRVIEVLEGLRLLGIKLALDDFGTGYSALGYLQRFPIDILKLDKSFIDDLLESTDREALVEAIVQLAASLALPLVVEGIELPGQRDRLADMGGMFGQGYLFGRPMGAADLEAMFTPQQDAVDEGAPSTLSVPEPRTASLGVGLSASGGPTLMRAGRRARRHGV
ncbi:MAG: hypothetical protein QOJ92_2460 [Frankiales bacterium]|nr:hypothetical protein [Frankiales bacterium]